MGRASQWTLPTVRGCGGFAAAHGERRVSYSLTTCLSNPKKLAKKCSKDHSFERCFCPQTLANLNSGDGPAALNMRGGRWRTTT